MHEEPTVCAECGEPLDTESELEHVIVALGRLCPVCEEAPDADA